MAAGDQTLTRTGWVRKESGLRELEIDSNDTAVTIRVDMSAIHNGIAANIQNKTSGEQLSATEAENLLRGKRSDRGPRRSKQEDHPARGEA